MIKRFVITKLFGFRDVDIKFKDNVKILIGENGLGKTTILNAMYFVLTQKYHKLVQINFESVMLVFDDNKTIKFKKYELENYIEMLERSNNKRIPKSFFEGININDIKKFITEEKDTSIEKIIQYLLVNKVRQFAPLRIMARELMYFASEPLFENFKQCAAIIDSKKFSVLYFPTYRRVEEDLKNLGKFRRRVGHQSFDDDYITDEIEEDIEISEDILIHFGMEDVELRIGNIEKLINKSTISGFSKLTGEMLSQLLRGFPAIDDKAIDALDENTVKIIIHRVGNNLSDQDRNTILNLLEKKDSLKKKQHLVYFILKLIDIYDQHKHLDDSVKKFVSVCNEYLNDKQFIYDESSVDVNIYRKKQDGCQVSLSMLSSGEKQIISLFSKLYLEDKSNLVVLFDEPELSLSLEWQKMLLPHVVDSNKCIFLLSVTHSPFIFNNDLDKYASGMSLYVKEKA